jgi:hypothetical protein
VQLAGVFCEIFSKLTSFESFSISSSSISPLNNTSKPCLVVLFELVAKILSLIETSI